MERSDQGLDRTVKEIAAEFASALGRAPAVVAFRHAEADLDSDREARQLLKRVRTLQLNLMRLNQSGREVPGKDLDALRALQMEAQDHPTIRRFLEAQRESLNFVARVKQEISNMLGIDFGALTSSGCC